jgi:hypothetical protein
MAELIEFETERLRLRQWVPGDREPFAALNADIACRNGTAWNERGY